jgi:ATP-binding cassette, subfamily F, member 3
MSLIVAENLVHSFSDIDVLKNVTFTLAPQQRVGLVGPNGEGKTTLMRIVAGELKALSGTLQRAGDLRVGYLPQTATHLAGQTLHEAMLGVFADLRELEAQLTDLAHKMEGHEPTPQELARYGQLQHDFEVQGGYTYTHRIERVLMGLKFPRDMWDRPLETFSGGQQMRAKLGRVLLEDPDVLLLDEPTNHMDLESVEWLQDWLSSFRGALIVISHDRYFLDHVTTRTWELSGAVLETYKGGYTHYLRQRDERFADRMKRWEAQQEYIRETQDFIQRFLAGQRSSEAKGRRTRLQRFMRDEAIPKPREIAHIAVRFKVVERAGDLVARLSDLQAGYENTGSLVDIESLDVNRGQRIAIVGPNGCGKTTLLKTILGELPAIAGDVRLGANVRIGYLSQTHAEWDPAASAIDLVRQVDVSAISEERARNLLGSLLLSNDDAFKKLTELSCGQQSRVFLARLMLGRANVLVMDEPTNHLDINSREVLQEVLSEFDGTVLFVSHDRYLIDALATDVWAMHDREVTPLRGDWDHYLEWRDGQLANQPDTAPSADSVQQAKADRKQSYEERREVEKLRRKKGNEAKKRQRRVDELETLIHDLEDALKAINDDISTASTDGDMDRITKLGATYTAQNTKLQAFYAEWEQLTDTIENE